MRILITNDDGYQSKGIRTLAEIMRPFGDVSVVAPKRHQSGMGMAVSLGLKQLAYKDLGTDGNGVHWSYLDATPASCVKYGLNFPREGRMPDVLVSGINHGSNACTAACYSGTLGAAMEGALNGILSIGVSLDNLDPAADFSAVSALFPRIFRMILAARPVPFGTYYNVNFPNVPAGDIKGIRAAVMGMGRWEKEFAKWNPAHFSHFGITPESLGQTSEVHLEEGEELYMMTGDYSDYEQNHPRADHHIMRDGYISISAHKIDTTDYTEFQRMLSHGFDLDF